MDDSTPRSGDAGPIPARSPATRRLAAGKDWSLGEFVCHAGPDDPPFEERHEAVSIAAVIEGTFNYASDSGRALMHPGALLLGNHGACYRCGHDHGTGDRCISLQISPQFFAEIAAIAGGSSRMRFPAPMLPASRGMLRHSVLLQAGLTERDPLHREEDIALFIAAAVRALSGNGVTAQRVSALDERRIARALHHIERRADQPLDLEQLAAVAAMSKFHFLRVFRRVAGLTPYQYLLDIRLRRAALQLLSKPGTVAAIAFDCGFGDLSTFNTTFRARFGISPTGYRRQATHG